MLKRMLVFGCALLFVMLITGCGDKMDEDEYREAEQLVQGLNMMAYMTNVDAYSPTTDVGFHAPPPFWEGPQYYETPEVWGIDTMYKWILIQFPLDSLGTTIDSMSLYLMFIPDIWMDSLLTPTGLAIGLLADNRDIWFFTDISIPDTIHVTGSLTWNWEETWYRYQYDVSQLDETADIDITTSSNIGLEAHFLFDEAGVGHEVNCYAEWNDVVFVRYEFFAEQDPNGYDGYYTLLSEAWKVRHYFTLYSYNQPVM